MNTGDLPDFDRMAPEISLIIWWVWQVLPSVVTSRRTYVSVLLLLFHDSLLICLSFFIYLYITADLPEVQTSDRTGWFSSRGSSSLEESVKI